MREIKFRGVDTDDANRGDVIVFTLEELLATSDDYGLIDTATIRQYSATDKNGKKVYEGDGIISRFGSYCLATFRHYGGIIDGTYTLEETRHV